MEQVQGIAVSPGIVFGPAFVIGEAEKHVPRREIAARERAAEVVRLDDAVLAAAAELGELRDRTARELGGEASKIFEFHLGLLKDPSLLDPIASAIRDTGQNAEAAVADRFRTLVVQFESLGSEVFRQKAHDVVDLERRVLGKLMGETSSRLAKLRDRAVLIAHELTPSEAAAIDRQRILAFATDLGGRTGHTSIVARALDLPAVVGCGRLSSRVEDGDLVIVDGDSGTVILRPDADTVQAYRELDLRKRKYRASLRADAAMKAETLDGTGIALLGNIEFPEEIPVVLENGGEGVGLYRTEFLFLTSPTEPTEEDHYRAYRKAIELLGGRPLTIRTLDLGADKYTQLRAEEPERNPFLGLRSIRYCLQNQPLFKTQLRAILRASVHGPVKVMFPLVSTVMELRQARMILNDVIEELEEEGVDFRSDLPIGMMIEVPSAALMAKTFAREVAFFSIGTNDLIQYVLAVDRGNERVAPMYSGANPAVLQLVKSVVRAARRESIDTSICGELAGEPLYTMLLLGMGLRTLSMTPGQIPEIKKIIRLVDIPRCERLARKVGAFDSERQVLNALRDELRSIAPDSTGGWTAE